MTDTTTRVEPAAVRGHLSVGDEIAGKYRVERVLGQGGMGVVLSAIHLVTQQRVALKLLLPDGARSPERAQRFMNEARAAVQIQSEHVARVTDVDRLPSGEPYLVMEYLEGHDLAALLAMRGPLPLAEALDYVLQACEALAEAHVLGIVHRDLKPANLFLTHRRDGSPLVKILDFGISRLNVDVGGPRLTQTRGTMGSPLYMSPEQLLTPKEVDARADLWALGVVLFELLTATWPFEAETVEGLVVEIATKPAAALRTRRPELPAVVEAAVARCLAKRRDERFSSVAELAHALAPAAAEGSRLSIDRVARIIGSVRSTLPSSAAATLDPLSTSPALPLSAPRLVPLEAVAGETVVLTPSAEQAAMRAGTASIEPIAHTVGVLPAPPTTSIAPRAPRWPLVAGGFAVLLAAIVVASSRVATPSPTARAPQATATPPSAAPPTLSADAAGSLPTLPPIAAAGATASATESVGPASATAASRPVAKLARPGAAAPPPAALPETAFPIAPTAPVQPPDFGGK